MEHKPVPPPPDNVGFQLMYPHAFKAITAAPHRAIHWGQLIRKFDHDNDKQGLHAAALESVRTTLDAARVLHRRMGSAWLGMNFPALAEELKKATLAEAVEEAAAFRKAYRKRMEEDMDPIDRLMMEEAAAQKAKQREERLAIQRDRVQVAKEKKAVKEATLADAEKRRIDRRKAAVVLFRSYGLTDREVAYLMENGVPSYWPEKRVLRVLEGMTNGR